MHIFKKILKKIWIGVRVYVLVCGIVLNLFVVWMAAEWPVFFDRLLTKSEQPFKGDYIVCLSGGILGDNLPTQEGWQRIYTAVQLYFDGYASKIIFTGGGFGQITQAEIYGEVAQWLGCPEDAIFCEPGALSTAEHPEKLLEMENLKVDRGSRINIVTSSLHSKRAALCFKKKGFTDFRLVTKYTSQREDPNIVRSLKESMFEDFISSDKKYDDIFMRLRQRSRYFFMALREITAISYYKLKGWI